MATSSGTDYDAIVIGGGPSGSSYTITLTKAGYTVLQLERDKFPRFHIGESLLPYTADVLEQLGVLHKLGEEGFPIAMPGPAACLVHHPDEFPDPLAGLLAIAEQRVEQTDRGHGVGDHLVLVTLPLQFLIGQVH